MSSSKLKKNARKKLAHSSSGKPVKICLNMIVRDEKDNIIRCFNSVRHLLDAIVICDTGSVDNTPDLIKEYLQKENLPGEVISRPWTNDFGKNRTEALRYAEEFIQRHDSTSQFTWYVMFMDADNQAFAYDGKSKFPSTWKSNLHHDCYDVEMRNGNASYHYPWLIRVDPEKRWKWCEPRHEYPAPDGDWKENRATITGGYVYSGREGFRSKNKWTYLEDAFAFLKQIREEPTNTRAVFYAAQSMRDCNNYDLAAQLYKRRARMGGWNEEVYMSLLYLGTRRFMMKKFDDKTIGIFLDALDKCPQRFEAPYYLIMIWRLQKKFRLGWELAKLYIDATPPTNSLFADMDIVDWGLYDEAAICAFYAGDKDKFKELSNRVLSSKLSPDNIKERVRKNLQSFG
jgi:glycosyltransferase involved in cell wall biosynthesis